MVLINKIIFKAVKCAQFSNLRILNTTIIALVYLDGSSNYSNLTHLCMFIPQFVFLSSLLSFSSYLWTRQPRGQTFPPANWRETTDRWDNHIYFFVSASLFFTQSFALTFALSYSIHYLQSIINRVLKMI